jgi:uncharacterized membrane protein SpoIIM required for sporulation
MILRWFSRVWCAISRARAPIVLMGLTYLVSVAVGISMVSMQNGFALRFRDKLIRDANATSQTLKSFSSGHRFRAAVLDCGANVFLGAIPNTVGGLAIVLPYPMAAFRGWVGGVVSVNNKHRSRLANLNQAVYYLGVLLLQIIAYTLAGGAGVKLGVRTYRAWNDRSVAKWWFMPKDAARDVLWIYSAAAPLFLIASMVEFLAA